MHINARCRWFSVCPTVGIRRLNVCIDRMRNVCNFKTYNNISIKLIGYSVLQYIKDIKRTITHIKSTIIKHAPKSFVYLFSLLLLLKNTNYYSIVT